MNARHLSIGMAAGAIVLAAGSLRGAGPAGPVDFAAHDVDANFRGGYAVSVADFNKDGKIDVIANSLSVPELAWYENPTWTRHVVVADTQRIVNQAMADLDGDGIPEIAFQSSFAMQPANSAGLNWIARQNADPSRLWKVETIDQFPTSHHIAWVDLDGDGRKELINAPLLGDQSAAPTYDQDQASIFWYSSKDWKRHLIANNVSGIIHRVRAVSWDAGRREQFLVASFEGIALYRPSGSGDGMSFEKVLLSAGHVEKAPRLGASDVGVGKHDGTRFLASVEPWHGNEVVVYTDRGGAWHRRVIFDKVTGGHEIAVIDLNGDGKDDVVANDNGRVTEQNPNATPGVHVFYAPADTATGEWIYRRIEDKAAMNSCVATDINGDKQIDIVCTGAGGAIKWYENRGPAKSGGSGGAGGSVVARPA